MKSFLALHFCVGIYLSKGSQSHQPDSDHRAQCFNLASIAEVLPLLSFTLIPVKYLLLRRSY